MEIKSKGLWAALCVILGGCVGAPSPYGPNSPAPHVEDITNHVTCEIKHSQQFGQLVGRSYLIKVSLQLQVDDSVDLTPSLALSSPVGSATDTVATTMAGDLGGARRHIFSLSYAMNASDLDDIPLHYCSPALMGPKLYRLDGDLGIANDIDTGLPFAIYESHPEIHMVNSVTDPAAPTFTTTIQFIVTKSLTNFGPIWTLKRFKGPGGGAGLLNAKRLDTDSITLTFVPQYGPVVESDGQKLADQIVVMALKTLVDAQVSLTSDKADLQAAQGKLKQFQAQLDQAQKAGAKMVGQATIDNWQRAVDTQKQTVASWTAAVASHAATVKFDQTTYNEDLAAQAAAAGQDTKLKQQGGETAAATAAAAALIQTLQSLSSSLPATH